jgi:hypothetical protein
MPSTWLETSTMTEALSAKMLVPIMPCPIIMAWAKLGPVPKFINAFIVGTGIIEAPQRMKGHRPCGLTFELLAARL